MKNLMILEIKPAINKDEIELCNGWCDWDSCNIPKWLCVECGNVKCYHCIDDHNKLVLTEKQNEETLSICRIYNSYNSFHDYGELRELKQIELIYDEEGEKVIKN
jgi:hypothetical protein